MDRDSEPMAEGEPMKTEVQIRLFIQGVAYPPQWIYRQPWTVLVNDEEDER